MDDTSIRLGLPLLQAGQAQKEVTHNEALTLLDFAVQAAAVAVGVDAPPATPVVGDCWVLGPAPSGAWTGQAHALAGWTGGGWRFVPACIGMTVWSRADATHARFDGSLWEVGQVAGSRLVLDGQKVVGARQAAIPTPSGGTMPDAEARDAVSAILAALRQHGLIAT